MPQLGLSFQPGMLKPGQQDGQPGGGAPGGVSPVQEAIQLLSFRLPTQAQGIAPMSLLMGRGGAGVPGAVSGTPTSAALARLRAMLGLDMGASASDGWSGADHAMPKTLPSAFSSMGATRVIPAKEVPDRGSDMPMSGIPEPPAAPPVLRSRLEDKYAGMYAPERLDPSF